MDKEFLDHLLRLFAFVPPLLLVSITFRLTALNTFVDHRKNALRGHLKDTIEKKCDALTFVIQSIGKVPGFKHREQTLFDSYGFGYRQLVDEIHGIRDKYSRLLLRFCWFYLAWLALIFTAYAYYVYRYTGSPSNLIPLAIIVAFMLSILWLIYDACALKQCDFSTENDIDRAILVCQEAPKIALTTQPNPAVHTDAAR